jgi:hypothetical protein
MVGSGPDFNAGNLSPQLWFGQFSGAASDVRSFFCS